MSDAVRDGGQPGAASNASAAVVLNADERRVHDEYRKIRDDNPTGIELYVGRSPVPEDVPVYVFQHTMKTGGTALRSLIYANVSPHAMYVAHEAPKSSKHGDLGDLYRNVLAQLSPAERARLLWVVGHTAAYAAPLIERPLDSPQSRPVRIVTIVREPVDRVMSRHWFEGLRSKTPGIRTDLIDELWHAYESPKTVKRRRHKGYANFQSQSIMAPYYDVTTLRPSQGLPADADTWRQRLFDIVERSHVLLVQDRLDEGIHWFAGQQRWQVMALPKVRVNPGRPAVSDLDPGLRAVIEAYNWLDAELYQHAVRQHEQRETDTSR